MIPHDTFGPPWKLLAQLFGEFGRISKIGIVDVDVLRDDRFDPSADTIGCLSLLNPRLAGAIRYGSICERRADLILGSPARANTRVTVICSLTALIAANLASVRIVALGVFIRNVLRLANRSLQ
jgi:hypothetical protein